MHEVASIVKASFGREGKETKKEAFSLSDDLTSMELGWFETAREQGLDVYKIFVKIASDCALKSARAYLVITRLEEIGELVKVVPPVEDLEKENFGDSFYVYLTTKEPKEVPEEILSSISDISAFKIELVEPEVSGVQVASQEPGAIRGQVDNKKAQEDMISDALNALKRQQSTTVRVDIGRLDKLMNLVGELVIGRARIERLAAEASLSEFEEPLL